MRQTFKPLGAAITVGLMLLALGVATTAAAEKRETTEGRYLKIRVYDGDSETPNVIVNLPLKAVTALFRLVVRSGVLDGEIHIDVPHGDRQLNLSGEDLEEFIDVLASMGPGEIITVQEDDERVEIWIE
jgi:hydroxymethylglutaryl-CoA reductase